MADLRDAVVVAAVRTPMGRFGGQLKDVRPDDLAAIVLREVVSRAGVDAGDVEDVIFGCANQAGEDNRNVARMGLLLAGFPIEVPGQTVNRLCGSGMQATIAAVREIQAGGADVLISGGVESMTRAPWAMSKPDTPFARGPQTIYDTSLGWRFINPKMAELYGTLQMGETAERVAERYEVSREDQDRFAVQSHQRAVAAQGAGRFGSELTPVVIPQKKGEPISIESDEGPRADASTETLGRLRPVFQEGGTVTAGNASSLNDGASALLLMSRSEAERRGLRPLATFVSSASVGVEPSYMGLGPVPATRKALAKAGLSSRDIDLAELNEAFAAQAVACVRELGLDEQIVNVNGGAIALGHPLGSSGSRLVGTLIHELGRRGGGIGLASMCIGVGQGIASIWRVEV